MAPPASQNGSSSKAFDTKEKQRQIQDYNLAQSYFEKGDYSTAASRYRKVLTWCEDLLDSTDSMTLDVRESLADCLVALGSPKNLKEAAALGERTLAIRSQERGDDDMETLETQHSLALAFRNLNNYAKAKELDQKTLAARQKRLGRAHKDTVLSRHNLAANLQDLGRYEEAEKLNRTTLDFRKQTCKEDDEHLIASRHNLAKNLHSLQRYEEAGELVKINVEILTKCRRPTDTQLATSRELEMKTAKLHCQPLSYKSLSLVQR